MFAMLRRVKPALDYVKINQIVLYCSAGINSAGLMEKEITKMAIHRLLEQLPEKQTYKAVNKREYVRLHYPPLKRPKLQIKGQEIDVIDISEKGVKILKDNKAKFNECLIGTLALLSGKFLDLAGKIIWEGDSFAGVLTTRIPKSVIVGEILTLV
jgi:hypothetical protein